MAHGWVQTHEGHICSALSISGTGFFEQRGGRRVERGHFVPQINQLDAALNFCPVLADRCKTVGGVELVEARKDRGMLAKDASDRPVAVKEAEGLMPVQNEHFPPLGSVAAREVEQIDEQHVLPDGIGPASLGDELELRDATICLEVVAPAGVTGAEGQALDHFSVLKQIGE